MNCTNNLSVVATLCAIIAFCSFVECSSETAQVVEGVGLHQLKLIGAVGTRSYFVEANQSMVILHKFTWKYHIIILLC